MTSQHPKTEPRTAAGRALLAEFRSRAARDDKDYPVHWLDADDILAIEAEAAASSERSDPTLLREALEKARSDIKAEISMASDPEGKDQFEKGALAAYNFALSVLPDSALSSDGRAAGAEPDWETTGHGAIRKHYPRTGDALRGFLGQGVTETVCDGCGVPMFLKDGKWSAAPVAAVPEATLDVERLREAIRRWRDAEHREYVAGGKRGDMAEGVAAEYARLTARAAAAEREPSEAESRYRPCWRCGRSPAAHNPHPLNDAYVHHEYE